MTTGVVNKFYGPSPSPPHENNTYGVRDAARSVYIRVAVPFITASESLDLNKILTTDIGQHYW